MRKRFIPFSILLICSSLVLSACSLIMATTGAALGAGVYGYFQGDLKASEPVSLPVAWKASRKTLDELGFKTLSEEIRPLHRKIIAESYDHEEVVIRLEEQTRNVTSFRIRVGPVGNEDVAVLIFEHIKKNF
ncbi:MAG: hypothetical protein ACI9S8_000218 [Chlamydiales bacterium]|jgi:hypothetical protein